MDVLIGVAFISTTGWLISLAFPNSAARRHLVLNTTLFACLFCPAVLQVRSSTNWTLLRIPVSTNEIAQVHHQGSSVSIEPNELSESSPSPGEIPLISSNEVRKNTQSSLSTSVTETEIQPKPASTEDNTGLNSLQVQSAITSNWANSQSWITWGYLCISGIMLLRLFVGLFTIQRIRWQAGQDDLTSNGIPILEGDVIVPLATGLGKPAIILPRGFREHVTADELQDVLDHEAEHLRRGDHWIMLLQAIASGIFWPVLTIHILNRALSRAREELCDNAVLTKREPTAYGQTLLTVGKQIKGRPTFETQIAPSIIRQGELERRVASLLDKRRDRRTQVRRKVRWTTILLLSGLAVFSGTTRLVAVPADNSTSNELVEQNEISKPERTIVEEHRGVVLSPEGKPLTDASIFAVNSDELIKQIQQDRVNLGPVRTKTDSNGRFEFIAEDLAGGKTDSERKWHDATMLFVTHSDTVPAWITVKVGERRKYVEQHPNQKYEVTIRTQSPATLSGQFRLENGKPLARARVRLARLMAPSNFDLEQHISREEEDPLSPFESINYAAMLNNPWILPGLNTETTADDNGRFELKGLPRDFITSLEITHPQAVTTTLRAAVRKMEPVYRQPFQGIGEPQLTLYGSGFEAELQEGMILKGQVTYWKAEKHYNATGVTVALANHNAKGGTWGPQFQTDSEGRFEVTGLRPNSQGYNLAFTGSFSAPFYDLRRQIVPREGTRIELAPAVPYRLHLVDPQGNPIDREVFSIQVQSHPGFKYPGVKPVFNHAQRVAPGLYEGIIPSGPAAVLVKREKRTDQPAAVDPKAFFAPGRTDWTLEEERYAYGDLWRIAAPTIVTTEELSFSENRPIDQLDLAAVVFSNVRKHAGIQELTATVYSNPPLEVTLVDSDNNLVERAKLYRQRKQNRYKELPATISVFGLHPQRAEFLLFKHEARGLIGTLSAKSIDSPVRVIMQPAATLIGKIVDPTGKINSDFRIRVTGKGVMPDTYLGGRVFHTTDEPGKRKGEFHLMVPPGFEVRGELVRKFPQHETRPAIRSAFAPLVPEPGETIDLGNIVVP